MGKSNSPFAVVGTSKVRRSVFDLTHNVKTSFWPGQLIPLPPIECIPGDVHRIRFNGVVRLQPLVTAMFQPLKLRFYSFFVPFRLLFDEWETFITGGDDGTSVVDLPRVSPGDFAAASGVDIGSLWDYFGFQVNTAYRTTGLATNSQPLDFPWRAYWLVWNEFFRIPGIQSEVDITTYYLTAAGGIPAYRNWQRDYFTSALPWTQRGIAPALPVFGSASAEFDISVVNSAAGIGLDVDNVAPLASFVINGAGPGSQAEDNLNAIFNDNVVEGDSFSSVDINDLRLAWQTQVWLERNARAGARYTEQLFAHYGAAPRDDRMQRPEFIGGSTTDIMVMEVLQTSETASTPIGTLAGKGIGLPAGHVGSYRVLEHGLIMNFVVVTPDATYSQGIPRSWLRRNRLDYPFPEFAALGEQEIYNGELFMQDAGTDPTGAENLEPFGYTGRYNEMRYIPNRVTSLMRTTLNNWHMAREFASLPPLNDEFVNMEGALSDMLRPFAVQSETPLLGIFAVGLDSMRPLPFLAEPSEIGG